jgi:hypothetical protein
MLRTRLLDRVTDGDERIPTALIMHRLEAVVASQRAIFGPVHWPPSSGGVCRRSFSLPSAAGVRIVGSVPLLAR